MTSAGIKKIIFESVCHLRSLQYFVESDGFEDLFNSDPEGISWLLYLARRGHDRSLEKLRELLRRFLKEELPIRQLRLEAVRLGIPRYSRMDRATLTTAIRHYRSFHNEVKEKQAEEARLLAQQTRTNNPSVSSSVGDKNPAIAGWSDSLSDRFLERETRTMRCGSD